MQASYEKWCTDCRAQQNSSLWALLGSTDRLDELDLSKNFVGTRAGFDVIIGLLEQSKDSLRLINLSFTPLTFENVRDLCNACRSMPNLTDLRLRNCCLGESSAAALLSLARRNKRVERIDVENEVSCNSNQFQLTTKSKLQRELSRHCL